MTEHDHGEEYFYFLDAGDMSACNELNMQWMREHNKLNRKDA
jgi:hypothetical protein